MPPKPWESKGRTQNQALSTIINQNSTKLTGNEPLNLVSTDQAANQMSAASNATNPLSNTDPLNPSANSSALGTLTNTTNTTGLTSTTSPYSNGSSMYGGYGSGSSMYGGYGSSYGSSMYGGYGGGYGSSMYGGGYGGYGGYGGMQGRYGRMGGDPNQPGFLQNSMQYLDYFGFVIQSLCEIARTLEMNAQGLHHFWVSAFNLISRMKGWGVSFYQYIKLWFKKIYEKLRDFIKQKSAVLFIGDTSNNVKVQIRLISVAMRIVAVMFVLSMFPLLKKALKVDSHEAIFKNLQNSL